MDGYDKEISLIRSAADPQAAIFRLWLSDSLLFRALTPNGCCRRSPDGRPYAGPIQIRRGSGVAITDEMTEAVRSDQRITVSAHTMKPENLEALAEHQRAADKAGRVDNDPGCERLYCRNPYCHPHGGDHAASLHRTLFEER